MAAAFAGACMLLTACGAKTTLPDLSSLGDTVVISREDGSGTRAEFERLVNTDGAGSGKIAVSTDEVLESVAADENAIGYTAFSSITDQNEVKILSIDGTTASADTIKKDRYALCRNYYLAYSGELKNAEADFLAYVLSAGQDIVADSCIPVKTAGTFLSDQSAGTITIDGSSSVAPILETLAEDYQSYNSKVKIEIQTSDSTAGLTAAMRGECDFAMSSRELESYEKELLSTETIGTDGIAVIVNQKNPLTDLSRKQIKELYDGTDAKWTDLK